MDELSALIKFDSDYHNAGFVSLKPGCLRTLQWAYLDLYSYALTGTPQDQIKKIHWGRALGCHEWQMGKPHRSWDRLLRALWNCVLLSSLPSWRVHTADCDSCLCPWPWEMHWQLNPLLTTTTMLSLEHLINCLSASGFQQLWCNHASPTAGAVSYNPNETGQNAQPMLWKYTSHSCLQAPPFPLVLRP